MTIKTRNVISGGAVLYNTMLETMANFDKLFEQLDVVAQWTVAYPILPSAPPERPDFTSGDPLVYAEEFTEEEAAVLRAFYSNMMGMKETLLASVEPARPFVVPTFGF